MGFKLVLILILSGVMDEGMSSMTQTTGDGFYQSFSWRMSSQAQLVCVDGVRTRARE
jgi:hypothetical protein